MDARYSAACVCILTRSFAKTGFSIAVSSSFTDITRLIFLENSEYFAPSPDMSTMPS